MTFSTGALTQIGKVGSGERIGSLGTILSTTTFEDRLIPGRFAKLDTGSIDNFDGSATPAIAGVVMRDIPGAVENDGVLDTDTTTAINYVRAGLVTVDVKAGETPVQFGRVYVSNAGDANDGKATATNTDVAVNAEFIEEINTNVWMIFIAPPPGDVASHTGDALAAHAASAISLLDAAGLTASANVETLAVELLPAVSRVAVIADPGDAGAIPVIRSGNCALTTAGSETRTLAAPGTVGISLDININVDGGVAVVTVASAINQTGNNTITLTEVGDYIRLQSVKLAGVPVWRVVANDGAVLTTV